MLLRNMSNVFNGLLSLGAFYLGVSMLSGVGVFETFPPEWIGKLPFNSWVSLALFGMIIFGVGNAIASIWGFIKKDKIIYIMTFTMGALLFFCTVLSTKLVGEWYLPSGQLLIASIIQLSLGLVGFIIPYFGHRGFSRRVN